MHAGVHAPLRLRLSCAPAIIHNKQAKAKIYTQDSFLFKEKTDLGIQRMHGKYMHVDEMITLYIIGNCNCFGRKFTCVQWSLSGADSLEGVLIYGGGHKHLPHSQALPYTHM